MDNENKEILTKVHIGHAIQEEMERQGRTIGWLADQICLTKRAVYKIYEKESLNSELIRAISNALNKNFFLLYNK